MEFHKFGPNAVRLEGALVFTVVHGIPSLDDCRRYLKLVSETAATHGRVFLLIDITKGFGLSPENRRYSVHWGTTHQITATACFGANAPGRAMMTFVVRAMDLASGHKSNTRFFSTEAEARAWLTEQRELIPTRRSSP